MKKLCLITEEYDIQILRTNNVDQDEVAHYQSKLFANFTFFILAL